jgi:hypothetical protein
MGACFGEGVHPNNVMASWALRRDCRALLLHRLRVARGAPAGSQLCAQSTPQSYRLLELKQTPTLFVTAPRTSNDTGRAVPRGICGSRGSSAAANQSSSLNIPSVPVSPLLPELSLLLNSRLSSFELPQLLLQCAPAAERQPTLTQLVQPQDEEEALSQQWEEREAQALQQAKALLNEEMARHRQRRQQQEEREALEQQQLWQQRNEQEAQEQQWQQQTILRNLFQDPAPLFAAGELLGAGGQGVVRRVVVVTEAYAEQNRIVTLCHSRKAIDLALSGWATSGVFRMQDFTTLLPSRIHIGGQPGTPLANHPPPKTNQRPKQ